MGCNFSSSKNKLIEFTGNTTEEVIIKIENYFNEIYNGNYKHIGNKYLSNTNTSFLILKNSYTNDTIIVEHEILYYNYYFKVKIILYKNYSCSVSI
jgi:hypothetical protein